MGHGPNSFPLAQVGLLLSHLCEAHVGPAPAPARHRPVVLSSTSDPAPLPLLQCAIGRPPLSSIPFSCVPQTPSTHAPLDFPPGARNHSTSEKRVQGNQRRGFIPKNPNESRIVMNSRIIPKSRLATTARHSSPPT
jgi:hypothetical protein